MPNRDRRDRPPYAMERAHDRKSFPQQEVPNSEVAHTAQQFRQAANLMSKDKLVCYLNIPLMCNAAFALELYLKSLNTNNVYLPDPDAVPGTCYMVFSMPNKKGHVLTEQYDELLPELKKLLDDAYAQMPVVAHASTFREALAAYDDVYVSSRYWFDPKYPRGFGPNITALIDLVNLVGECIETLPGWTIRK